MLRVKYSTVILLNFLGALNKQIEDIARPKHLTTK